MIFLIFLSSVLCYISFDSQSSSVFNPPASGGCSDGDIFENEITFSGTFKNIPQIIIADSWYTMDNMSPNEFQITIPPNTITTTSFHIIITCPRVRVFRKLEFRWAAIDDQRIQVITDLVKTTSIGNSQIYTYDLYNPNLSQGFMSLLSFGYKGPINFTLSIDSISYNQVSIKISSTISNLLSVGFQAILGTSEAFKQSDTIDWKITLDTPYNSDTLTVSPGYKLMIPISGMRFEYQHQLNFDQTYNDDSATTGQITYQYTSYWEYEVERLSFREAWINTQITKTIYPSICKKARVTSYYDKNFLSGPTYSLYIVEVDQQFDSTSGTQEILIDNTIHIIKMKIQFRCLPTKKVYSKLMKCTSCTPFNHIIQQNCYGGMNTMVINTQFYQADSVNQLLLIQTNSQGFSITQTVYNQESATYTLVDVSIGLI